MRLRSHVGTSGEVGLSSLGKRQAGAKTGLRRIQGFSPSGKGTAIQVHARDTPTLLLTLRVELLSQHPASSIHNPDSSLWQKLHLHLTPQTGPTSLVHPTLVPHSLQHSAHRSWKTLSESDTLTPQMTTSPPTFIENALEPTSRRSA